MSQSIHIILSYRPQACGAGWYVGDVVFELESWLPYSFPFEGFGPWTINDVEVPVYPLDKDLDFFFVNRMEKLTKELINDDCVLRMTYAKHLKGIKLYKDEWHETRVVWAKAVMAFLAELPDDWTLFLWEV